MKKLFIALLLLLGIKSIHAQIGIGLRAGYAVGSFNEGNLDPLGGLTIGIPIEYTINNHFTIRADLSYYRFGTFSKKFYVTQSFSYDRSIFYDALKIPVSLMWTPLSIDHKVHLSLNAGLGYGLYVQSVFDIVNYLKDVQTNEVAITESRARNRYTEIEYDQNEVFAVISADIGAKINGKTRVTLNLRYMQGLHDLHLDINKQIGDPDYAKHKSIGLSASIILLRHF